MKFNNIGFIGLGLIGGSIAKAIKQTYPDTKIYAHASHIETISNAYKEGIIDNETFLSLEAFGSLDVIFLCSPVKVNLSYLEQLKPFLKETALLTDVGSVKGDIHKKVKELGLSSQFIGGHPMTGSEKIGFAYSDASLLENAYYILTKGEALEDGLLQDFKEIVASLGALPMILTPAEHDFATAAISHLPHVISASLVNLVKDNDANDVLKTIAAGGFKDITRISSSSPIMWQNICIENKDEIQKLIQLYKDELDAFEQTITSENLEDLLSKFASAKDYRDSLPVRKASLLPQTFECFVDIPDETGVIARVAVLLADHNISMQNIGIVNNREFEEGALHIELKTQHDLDATIALLKENDYHIHVRN